MSLFLLSFFTVYGGAHAYALYKAHAALGFGWKTTIASVPPLAALACGPLIVYYLGAHGMENASRTVSWVAYTWMGLLFFFLWTNLALDAVNLLARAATAVSGKGQRGLFTYGRPVFLFLAALSVVLGAWSFFEADRVRVAHHRILTDKLPAGTPRIRVAQISDVHLGLMVRHREAAEIAEAVRNASPDIFISTGDLVDGRTNHLDGLSDIFREVRAPLGKYAVMGNHEFYAGIDTSLEFTRRAGFTVLRGEAAAAGGVLRIAGVDDPVSVRFQQSLDRSEEGFLGRNPSPLFTILLKHRPIPSPTAHRTVDLQLSGHTHNGQIFPFRFLVRLWYPLLAGPHPLDGGGILYTSPGTGTWGPRMRFLSPPEVTIFDIAPAGSAK